MTVRLVTVQGADGRLRPGFLLKEDHSRPYTFEQAIEILGGWQAVRADSALTALDENVLDSVLSLIAAGEGAWQAAANLIARFREGLESGSIQAEPAGTLAAPIPRPAKNIICVGRNYAEHAKERGADVPQIPVFFTKAPTCVTAPDATVPYPAQTNQFDYEGELAVIIGRTARNVPRERAYEYVFGYTIMNDLTARDLQRSHQQWFRGKSLDGTAPLGPAIVTPDEIGDPENLTLETRVNGEVRQSASTAQMVFDIPTLIEVLSDGMTLEPGDIIATGTPSGVGAATDGLLQPGDRVEIRISGLGVLTTTIGPKHR